EALYIDGPRVASAAWSGLCYSPSSSRAVAEAACNADPDCTALHDNDCTDIGVRYCYSAISDIVANWEGTNSRACTYIKYQVTASTLSTTTSVGVSATATTDSSAASTSLTTRSAEALYIDGPRVASSAWSGLCYSPPSSRADAEAACNADPDCTALHDNDCTDTGVRYCYSAISDIVANWEGTNSRACTYIKYQVTTSIRTTTRSSTMSSGSTASTLSGTATRSVTSTTAATTTTITATVITSTATDALYIDGPRVASSAWSGLCYSPPSSRADAEAACNADPDCIALHDNDCTNTGVRYCYSAISDIVVNWGGTNSRACTYIKYQVTTSTLSTTTSTIATVSTEALYIEGPRVASAAWSGLCYSPSSSRADAEAACNADPDCTALHDNDCTNTGVRYCYSAISDIVVNWEGTDSRACTYIKYQVTT
ncbi:unnamed protein product, partial [Prorocentrum cordatum]